MLAAEKLSKRYGAFTALGDVSFRLPKGSATALLGPNGAGKTTLMRILTGFHPPSEGRFTLDGVDGTEDPDAVKRRTGYLPERPPLYDELRVREFLDFAAGIKGIAPNKKKAAVDLALESVGLEKRSRQLLGTLSKGYRQRAGLAMAILGQPELLILDEPTSGLDPNQTVEIRETIKGLAKNATVLFSSHLLPEVEAVCDRFLVLANGKLLADAGRDEIKAMASTAGGGAVQVLLGSGDGPGVAASVKANLSLARAEADGQKLVFADPRFPGLTGDLVRQLVQAGADIREIHPLGSSLEDVFRKLTAKA